MRVIWIVNIVLPDLATVIGKKATVFGGWVPSLANDLRSLNNIELAIITPGDIKEIFKKSINGITYYIIPGGDKVKLKAPSKKYKYNCCTILNDYKPDIIHIHGTEYATSLGFLEYWKGPFVVSIQGLVSEINEKYFFSGIEDIYRLRMMLSPYNVLKYMPILIQKERFAKRVKWEKNILKLTKNVIGRTNWDRINVKRINPNVNYYNCKESLRKPFYNIRWQIKNIKRYTIFVGSIDKPVKGFHKLLEALFLLKKNYSELHLYAAGRKLYPESIIDWKKRCGYFLYLQDLIKKYDLKNNITFMGLLSAEEVAKTLQKVHTYVLSSSIENSPNMLGEAMLVGTPCVVSYVGGVMDMVEDRKEALFYRFEETAILADKISKIWEDDKLSITLSQNSRKRARRNHNRDNNVKMLEEIYKTILTKNN